MVRQKREHANYFSTIIRVERGFKKATLAHNNQPLTDSSHRTAKNLLQVLKKADSWHEHMQSNPSVTQSDIAKSEGISRSRVAQLLQLAQLPTEIKCQVESDKIQSVNQFRKRLKALR